MGRRNHADDASAQKGMFHYNTDHCKKEYSMTKCIFLKVYMGKAEAIILRLAVHIHVQVMNLVEKWFL